MQTKKRVSGRTVAREHGSSRISIAQKKASEKVQVFDKKVLELITSSARKQKRGTLPKKTQETVVATKRNTRSNVKCDEMCNAPSRFDEGCKNMTSESVMETIFSPAFHVSKIAGEEIVHGGDFNTSFEVGVQRSNKNSGTESSNADKPDMLDAHVTEGTFQSSFVHDQKYSQSTLMSINASCHSDIVVDASISRSSDVVNFADQMVSMEDAVYSCCSGDSEGVVLSSEVSAIYLAMKNSKLECVDEHGQDSIPNDVCLEDDDIEEYEDFDPYFFIKNLPELSSVVPTFRPMLLPRQTRRCPSTTLVLDLDETLVHSTLEPCDDANFTFPVNFNLQEHTVFVRCRPFLRDFMDRVSKLFEIIIFTASQSIYAHQLLNILDPKRKVFRHRVFRESCVFVEGNYLKDLSVLGRDLSRVIIVDNSPQAFGFQVDNGIPIESWFDDRSDEELLLLLPFLESLVGVEDVRPRIAMKYNLREKIAAADYPLHSNRGHPFKK